MREQAIPQPRVPTRYTFMNETIKLNLGRLAIGAAFCVVWWALVASGVVSAFHVSTPGAVAAYLVQSPKELLPHGAATLGAMIGMLMMAVSPAFGEPRGRRGGSRGVVLLPDQPREIA